MYLLQIAISAEIAHWVIVLAQGLKVVDLGTGLVSFDHVTANGNGTANNGGGAFISTGGNVILIAAPSITIPASDSRQIRPAEAQLP